MLPPSRGRFLPRTAALAAALERLLPRLLRDRPGPHDLRQRLQHPGAKTTRLAPLGNPTFRDMCPEPVLANDRVSYGKLKTKAVSSCRVGDQHLPRNWLATVWAKGGRPFSLPKAGGLRLRPAHRRPRCVLYTIYIVYVASKEPPGCIALQDNTTHDICLALRLLLSQACLVKLICVCVCVWWQGYSIRALRL